MDRHLDQMRSEAEQDQAIALPGLGPCRDRVVQVRGTEHPGQGIEELGDAGPRIDRTSLIPRLQLALAAASRLGPDAIAVDGRRAPGQRILPRRGDLMGCYIHAFSPL